MLGTAVPILLLLASMTASAGETLNYTGRIYADRAASLMPLGNGNGAMVIEAAGIVAMSAAGGAPSAFGLSCVGLGIVDTEGKADSEVYCTLKESDTDSFDLKGRVKEGDGSFEVIGGSGRFAGATGKAKYTRLDKAGEENTGGGTGLLEAQVKIK
jgi:hypothetical protein